ncbi:MAG: hypothetical protein ACREEX_10630 [Caulobacteraceae bacterium]
MSANVSARLDPLRWLGLPLLACAAASLVLATPIRLFGLQLPEPVFPMVPAFAWAMIRPSVLPAFALFALGLFLDLLWGAPLGLWPLVLLAAYAPTLIGRSFVAGQEFIVQWAWYGAACAVGLGAGWLFMLVHSGEAASFVGLFWQFVVSAALFPLAWRLIVAFEDADVRFR